MQNNCVVRIGGKVFGRVDVLVIAAQSRPSSMQRVPVRANPKRTFKLKVPDKLVKSNNTDKSKISSIPICADSDVLDITASRPFKNPVTTRKLLNSVHPNPQRMVSLKQRHIQHGVRRRRQKLDLIHPGSLRKRRRLPTHRKQRAPQSEHHFLK